MIDESGHLPEWAVNGLKITAGVAAIAAGMALAAFTFGGMVPMTVLITATAIGTVGGATTNAAVQYSKNKSWEGFNIDEWITAGVSGGLSATLATTPIKIGGQMLGNALISGTNSIVNKNSVEDVVADAGIGALAGLAGGSGTGRGGLVFSETFRNKQLLTSFVKSYIKSSVVGNTRSIYNKVRGGVSKIMALLK